MHEVMTGILGRVSRSGTLTAATEAATQQEIEAALQTIPNIEMLPWKRSIQVDFLGEVVDVPVDGTSQEIQRRLSGMKKTLPNAKTKEMV